MSVALSLKIKIRLKLASRDGGNINESIIVNDRLLEEFIIHRIISYVHF